MLIVIVESEMGLRVEGFISLYINDLLRTTNFGSPGVCVPWCFRSSLFSSQIILLRQCTRIRFNPEGRLRDFAPGLIHETCHQSQTSSQYSHERWLEDWVLSSHFSFVVPENAAYFRLFLLSLMTVHTWPQKFVQDCVNLLPTFR